MDTVKIVDRLGIVLAQKAVLEEEEKALKAALISQGVGEYEGLIFRSTVSISERSTLDMAAVRAKLSAQFIRANTNTTMVTMVRTNARKGLDPARKAELEEMTKVA